MRDLEFKKLVSEGVDAIPQKFKEKLDNIVIVVANEPTKKQKREMELKGEDTLFGLYEGIPQSERGSDYTMVLPDKITIFKNPILSYSHDPKIIRQEIMDTVWHEIGHHFGLDEEEVEMRHEKRRKSLQNGRE